MRTLKLSVLLLSVLPLATSAQAIIQAPVEMFTASGIVKSLTDHEVQILIRGGPYHANLSLRVQGSSPEAIQTELRRRGYLRPLADFSVNEDTEVLKGGTTSRDLSSLAVDDEVAARYQVSPDGKTLIAVKLTTDTADVRGLVQEAGPENIEVEIGSGDSTSVKLVRLSNRTVYGFIRALAAGEEISVVGWDFGDAIDATRITVYNTDLPVQPPTRLIR
jgi:hypothetical protein